MACVFQLGPKSNFGRSSEQNPAYWLKLFISSKSYNGSPTYSWHDPIENTTKKFQLNGSQWVRFVLSYLINGVGFHILVHALPIQIAAQSSLTGVVFRAVGMIYLVDLDDTSGYEVTLIDEDTNDVEKADDTSVYSFFGGSGTGSSDHNELDVVKAAEKIIINAQTKLDALRLKRRKSRRKKQPSRNTGSSWGKEVPTNPAPAEF